MFNKPKKTSDNRRLQQILNEVKCIDDFVTSEKNEQLTNFWYDICEASYVFSSVKYTSVSKIDEELFANYEAFIHNVPIIYKIDYIYFYETYFGRTWRELPSGSNVPREQERHQEIEAMGTNKRWVRQLEEDWGLEVIESKTF